MKYILLIVPHVDKCVVTQDCTHSDSEEQICWSMHFPQAAEQSTGRDDNLFEAPKGQGKCVHGTKSRDIALGPRLPPRIVLSP